MYQHAGTSMRSNSFIWNNTTDYINSIYFLIRLDNSNTQPSFKAGTTVIVEGWD